MGERSQDIVVFFFQAEDGIRDVAVTGVQTCALPIYRRLNLRLIDVEVGVNMLHVVVLFERLDQPHHLHRLRTSELDVILRHHCDFRRRDRKSTRLNSSHGYISYAVFCLKKKKIYKQYYELNQYY